MNPAPQTIDDSIRYFGCRAASSALFAAAAVELCTRLWMELERLGAALAMADAQPTQPMGLRIEMLRLELVIIVDRCAHRWSERLDQRQRTWLKTVMLDVLATLDGASDEPSDRWSPLPLPGHGSPDPQWVMGAQNRLLSAILEQCSDLDFPGAVRGILTAESHLAHERTAQGGRSWAHF